MFKCNYTNNKIQEKAYKLLIEELKKAVDSNHTKRIIDSTSALDAFYNPYCTNWDEKFMKVWEFVVKKED